MRTKRFLRVFLILCTSAISREALASPVSRIGGYDEECQLATQGLYVCLSSEAEELDDGSNLRWIEIHWWGISTPAEDDYVGIWQHDPSLDPSGMVESYPISATDGGVMTSLRFDGSQYPHTLPETSVCLPYWAAYVQNGTVEFSSCFALRPRWMSDIKFAIQDYRIAEISLPGSHDAGAYEGPDTTHLMEKVAKWTFTQDETFWQSLMLGTRYFDMRISYYNNTVEKFFVNHGDVQIRPLEPYLDDISRFLRATNEIIIFDIHLFEHGFKRFENAKPDLTELLLSYFKEWMVPQALAPNPLLSTIWDLNKQIIVTFPENETFSHLIWNETVHHVWGNVNNLEDMNEYMSTNITEYTGSDFLWSTMAEFTPNGLDITRDRWGGLRGAANITNEPVSLSLRRDWWTSVNIVAMDFIASSDVIHILIEANLMKKQCNITGSDFN